VAAEHSTAILVAYKNKMDLAMNIAIGSSIQIALFVAPVLIFLSYLFGTPMDLIFTTLEVVSIGLAVWIVTMIAHDGESNWIVSNSTGIIMKTYQRIIRHSMLTSLK